MSGFVYVIESSSGLFKIGYSNDPNKRLTMLRTSTADHLTLVGFVPGTRGDEQALHELLRPWWVMREWFKPCRAMQPLLDALWRPAPKADRWVQPITLVAVGIPDVNVASARAELGCSQVGLAKLMGVDQSTVSNWERQRNTPHRSARILLEQLVEEKRATAGEVSA